MHCALDVWISVGRRGYCMHAQQWAARYERCSGRVSFSNMSPAAKEDWVMKALGGRRGSPHACGGKGKQLWSEVPLQRRCVMYVFAFALWVSRCFRALQIAAPVTSHISDLAPRGGTHSMVGKIAPRLPIMLGLASRCACCPDPNHDPERASSSFLAQVLRGLLEKTVEEKVALEAKCSIQWPCAGMLFTFGSKRKRFRDPCIWQARQRCKLDLVDARS